MTKAPNTKEDSIIEKIAKLLAKAESAKAIGNLEEAESFSAKVTQMLQQHNLDMHRVRMATAAKLDKFAGMGVYGEHISHKDNLAGDRWQKDLIKMLCRHNLTGVIFNADDKGHKLHKTFTVYGDMLNVDTTVWLYNWLSTNLLVLARLTRNELSPEDYAKQCRHTYMKNFLFGAIHAIDSRLTKQTEEMANAAGNDGPGESAILGNVYAMIKYNNEAVEAFARKQFPGMFKTQPRAVKTNDGLGYVDGLAVGATMDLGDRKKLTAAKEKAASKIKLLK